MIKFRGGQKDGRDVVGLGLSAENLRRLRAGQPIDFDGAEIGLGGIRFLIFAGRDEESMRAQLAEFIKLPDERGST